MIRNLKVLGLALVAVFAMSAVVASAASAQDVFTSDSPNEKTILTGESEEPGVFLSKPSGGAKVTCKHSFYTGTVAGNTATKITVHPEYPDNVKNECESPGIGTAKVNTHGCDYVLTGETDSGEDATVELECTTGKFIEVVVSGVCTLKFGTQAGLKGVHYDNKVEANGKKDVTVTVTVTGVHFTKEGGLCSLVPCTETTKNTCTSGVLNENVTVTGWEDKKATQDPITHTWTVEEGPQVNIEVSEGI